MWHKKETFLNTVYTNGVKFCTSIYWINISFVSHAPRLKINCYATHNATYMFNKTFCWINELLTLIKHIAHIKCNHVFHGIFKYTKIKCIMHKKGEYFITFRV